MSDEQQANFVLPTNTAVHRYMQMKVEAILNTEYQVTDELTPLEHALTVSKDADETADLLGLPEDQHEIAVDILEEALDGGSVEELYGLTGGILNILLPMTQEEQDFVLTAIDEEEEGALSWEQYANAPNELFSALTPAQIWVGTGKVEMQLADAILPRLWEETQEMEFPTPGAANSEWLSRLRLWSYNPAGGGRGRIIDVIHAERNQNLEKRTRLAQELDLEVEFLPVE